MKIVMPSADIEAAWDKQPWRASDEYDDVCIELDGEHIRTRNDDGCTKLFKKVH